MLSRERNQHMESMTRQNGYVVGGVDTHKDTHLGAVVDQVGEVLASAEFPATATGYRQLTCWMISFGTLNAVGVEGTGSYGAGLARHLISEGVPVVEVIRPNRQTRRRYGKSDTVDAVSAARAVLSGEAQHPPRGGTGPVESIRMLQIARQAAVQARTATANRMHSVIVTAPEPIRQQLAGMSITKIAKLAAHYRPAGLTDPTQAAKQTLKSLAQHWLFLTDQKQELDSQLEELVHVQCPALLTLRGVGTQTAVKLLITAGSNPERLATQASFAALCGVSPVDASSGKQQHHRLNRGGDRQANNALWTITLSRLSHDPRTRTYVERRTQEGLTKKDIIRCLKRYIVNEIRTVILQNNPTLTT